MDGNFTYQLRYTNAHLMGGVAATCTTCDPRNNLEYGDRRAFLSHRSHHWRQVQGTRMLTNPLVFMLEMLNTCTQENFIPCSDFAEQIVRNATAHQLAQGSFVSLHAKDMVYITCGDKFTIIS